VKTKIAIGHIIRQRRKELNLTLREVNPYISYAHLSEVERGHKEISNDLLDLVTESLDMTRSEFMLRVANLLHQEEKRSRSEATRV
jgi:transcriptional regulator with XRE-family HTH domain